MPLWGRAAKDQSRRTRQAEQARSIQAYIRSRHRPDSLHYNAAGLSLRVLNLAGQTLFGGKTFAAFLFDMDGTLLSSIEAAERVWRRWAVAHDLDVATFLPTIHGSRSADTIRRLALPGLDADAEANAITQAEIVDVQGVRPIKGASAFVAALPVDRWAIVTSAPRALALARLEAAALKAPAVMVTAEDVTRGKPDPEGYQLSAARLGVPVEQCLIFEDAAAGIDAAVRASATVLVVTETHQHPLTTQHSTTKDYTSLAVVVDRSGGLILRREPG
jgi:mannitol-1-/sugar-/sorbitol-6-phosphatase